MKKLFENKLIRVTIVSLIVIILIIVIIALFVGKGPKNVSEKSLISAAEANYKANSNLLPKTNYESTSVSLATLISTGYMSSNVNSTCPSYVTVTNISGTYHYTPTLACDNNGVTSSTLVSKLVANRVTSGSGLYYKDGSYIYRGENPKNYVKFGESLWRIIGLDKNGNIKMIYNDLYLEYQPWDDRYNKDIENQKGINEYLGNEKSRIKEFLDNFFSTAVNKERFTPARISRTTTHSACVGKLDLENKVINSCSKILDNQRFSTITVQDYVNASLDSSCSMTNTITCQNYNFLNLTGWTANAYSGNTYSAYYIDADKGIQLSDAFISRAIRPIIALKKDVLYHSGTGTELDPYMIR